MIIVEVILFGYTCKQQLKNKKCGKMLEIQTLYRFTLV
jgi:hypothetical protein